MKLKNVIKNIGNSFFILPAVSTMSCTSSQKLTDLDTKQILENFKNNFEKKQNTIHRHFYPDKWKIQDVKNPDELGIKIPENSHQIEIKFTIIQIDLENGKILVNVETRLNKNQDSFKLEIRKFKLKKNYEFEKFEQLFTNIVIKNGKLLPSEINEENAFSTESGIQWPNQNLWNGHKIKIIDIYDANDDQGIVKIRALISKNNLEKQIEIIIENGKTHKKTFQELKKYFKQFNKSNMFDLTDKEINKESNWEDVVEVFKNQLKNKFSEAIIKNIEIKINTQKTVENKINLEDDDTPTFSNHLWFTYNQNQSVEPIEVWFKNVEINEQQMELYKVKKDLKTFLREQHPIKIKNITSNELIKKIQEYQEYKDVLIDKEEIEKCFGIEIPKNDLNIKIKGKINQYWEEIFDKKDVVSIIIYLSKGEEQIILDKDLMLYIE